MRSIVVIVFALAIGSVVLPASVRADGGWLDQEPPAAWNLPGASVPAAPASGAGAVNPECGRAPVVAQSAEERAVRTAGWYLLGAEQRVGSTVVVGGGSGYDGMCRPLGYQYFVFVGGVFAGTVSPVVMDSRSDGAANLVTVGDDGAVTVQFARYTEQDALCCPSRLTTGTFQVVVSKGSPVLRLLVATTVATGA